MGPSHCTDQWQSLPGTWVEIRLNGIFCCRGLVDDSMPDASGLWLAGDGADTRRFFSKQDGYQVWTTLFPLSPQDA